MRWWLIGSSDNEPIEGVAIVLPLEGVRVLDLAIMYAGPGSTMCLGDMGGDVIKIEQHAGDDSRGMLGTPFLGRNSGAFMVMNRNNRGMVLDLRQPAGKEILHRLGKTRAVLFHNYRPGGGGGRGG